MPQLTYAAQTAEDHDPEDCREGDTHPDCAKYQADLARHERWCEDAWLRHAEADHDGQGALELAEHDAAQALWGIR
jgi:hypothetical protein